jgi:hypothetical protein
MVCDEQPRMADQSVGMSIVNRDCNWVRARLPLWVGDGSGDQIESLCERGELAAKDCREIEQHIGGCTTCCQYQISLEKALAALFAAAVYVPPQPDALSLWPALEHRIASHDARMIPPWRRAAGYVADQWVRARTLFDRDQPLRLRWIYDSVREALFGPKHHAFEFKRKSGLVLRYGIMSLLSIALFELLVLHREWADAQSLIVINSSPLTNPFPTTTVHKEIPPLADLDMVADESASQLADAELPRTSEASGSGIDGASTAKLSSQMRSGYDLDRGTPMAPETRDSKPAY